MQSMNKLGLKVAILSALVVLIVFGAVWGVRTLLKSDSPNIALQKVTTPTPDTRLLAGEDQDGDNLADDVELIYRTDPNNPDTDGDGTPDGEEISLLRNPAVAGPEDTLEYLSTAEGPDPDSYTGRYLATLPANATQQDVLSGDKLEAFIEEEKGELLPEIQLSEIKQTDSEGADAIKDYLDLISPTQNKKLVTVTNEDINTAFQATYANQNTREIDKIVSSLKNNISILQEVSVPAEAVELHQELVAASTALLNNVALLANMQTDFIGGLIGAKNIEELGPIFADIAEKISALEVKYNIE